MTDVFSAAFQRGDLVALSFLSAVLRLESTMLCVPGASCDLVFFKALLDPSKVNIKASHLVTVVCAKEAPLQQGAQPSPTPHLKAQIAFIDFLRALFRVFIESENEKKSTQGNLTSLNDILAIALDVLVMTSEESSPNNILLSSIFKLIFHLLDYQLEPCFSFLISDSSKLMEWLGTY